MKVEVQRYPCGFHLPNTINVDGRKKTRSGQTFNFQQNPTVKSFTMDGIQHERRDYISFWQDYKQVDLETNTYIDKDGYLYKLP